jgi:glucose/arabinose dehydrogenase
MNSRAVWLLPASCILVIAALVPPAGAAPLPVERIRMPEGFGVAVYADSLRGARSLCLGEAGTVFVGTRGAGNVYAVRDKDGDGRADSTYVIASGLNMPNGVAFRQKSLYVAEVSRVLRFDDIERNLGVRIQPVVVRDDFPTDTHHGWKFIAFGPDDLLYVPVGAPCNVCLQDDPRYASIMRMKPDGSEPEVFAHGVRNTVGFSWHPRTKELWFTDNGRDWLGDDLPPDELNCAPVPGLHFGFPYCHGGDLPDSEWGSRRDCSEFAAPVQKLGPHVAALGMRFYTGGMFPARYREQIFIAEHGSWNRSTPLGYRITRVRPVEGKAVEYEVFAEGWLSADGPWGRPVDILMLPDGSMLVSDDLAGAIYRITYREP